MARNRDVEEISFHVAELAPHIYDLLDTVLEWRGGSLHRAVSASDNRIVLAVYGFPLLPLILPSPALLCFAHILFIRGQVHAIVSL